VKGSVLLNWIPFDNPWSGSARRAVELHSRLARRFRIRAAVKDGFSGCGVATVKAAARRGMASRLSEGLPWFWRRLEPFDLWVTDTLPVPRFVQGVRTVITVHDLRHLADRRYLSPGRYLLLKMFLGPGIARADAVVTVSEWMAGCIGQAYPSSRSKLHVIPNAPAPPAGDDPPPVEPPYILTVGHLEARKDQGTLLEAFSRISGKWEGKLVLVGRGPLQTGLQNLAERLGIRSRVVFAGAVDDRRRTALYRGCSCLVCPSLYEGFNLTVLEGLAEGIPVAVSDIPPHRETAGGAASYFTPGDPEALAETLLSVLRHVDFSPETGMARAAEFSWDASAARLGDLYESLLKGV
jgi:glycosyltransferase involved in cell wall biosynthesis